MKVRNFNARVTLNSKAEPNLEVCVNGFCSSPPSGTSRSSKEVEPWPKSKDLLERVVKAKHFAEEILGELLNKDIEPVEVEKELIERKEEIGGNTLLSITMSLYKAAAKEEGLPLWKYLSQAFNTKPAIPKPLENVIGGGKHGGNTDIQEFLLFPRFEASAEEYVLTLSKAYRGIKQRLREVDRDFVGSLTLESAWVSYLPTEEILSILSDVAEEYDLCMGMDVAASDIFREGAYVWEKEGVIRDREAQIDYMEELVKKYGIAYLEDPLDENDPDGFVELQKRLPDTIVTGDDLFATNTDYLVEGVGGIIIKYNQRGSIVETVETVKESRKLGMKIIVSHRSGETEDTFLTHFAVAVGADLFKAGAAGIRIVKLNELVRIGETLE